MQLSRALSDLVKYTKSVGTHDVDSEGEGRPGLRGPWRGAGPRPPAPLTPRPAAPAVASSWQVSSFSETKAQQILQQKPEQYLRFNQRQLSRVYPSSFRVDSSNYDPQPFWNAGCQMGGWVCGAGAVGAAGRAPPCSRLSEALEPPGIPPARWPSSGAGPESSGA